MKAVFAILTALVCGVSAIADDELPVTTFEVPYVGGWVMDPDLETLIISSPETGELYYIDTVKATKPKVVSVPFKPDWLALQGDQLFATVRGSTLVYALNAKTGKVLRRYKLPGTAVKIMACHPAKGPVFVSNVDEEVIMLDPKSTEARKTKARGIFLAVDPKDARYLYTATNRPSEDVVEVTRGPNDTFRFQLVTVAETAAVLKYEIERNRVKLVGGNPNTAVGAGGYLHVSPDGARFVMVAGGGWRSTVDRRTRFDIAVFETEDMTTMLGGVRCGAPQSICFHPVLDIGVALGNYTDFYVFDSQSLIHRSQRKVTAGGPVKFWHRMLTFGGKGTQIVTLQGNYLHLIPLDLTEEQRATLTKRFGPLPKIVPKKKTTDTASQMVALGNAPGWKLAEAKPRVPYLTDRAYSLKTVPDQIAGGTLLVRPAVHARNWLAPDQLNAVRDGTVYVALLVKFMGQQAVSPKILETLKSEGWKTEKDAFAVQAKSTSAWEWQILSRKVSKGPIDVASEVQLQAPTQAVFLFK